MCETTHADDSTEFEYDAPAGAVHNDNLTCPACDATAVHVISSNLGRAGPFSKPTRSMCANCNAKWDYEDGEHEFIRDGDVRGTDDDDDSDDDDDDDFPREYGPSGEEGGTVMDAFDDLDAGDRVLWGDRSMPCTVARVVEPDDHIGQALTASVIKHDPEDYRNEYDPDEYEYGRHLQQGDVFLPANVWGQMTGKRFVLIHGPRGGFYAIVEPEDDRSYPALFRAVRSYHSTKYGQPHQGAFKYEEDFDYRLTVVDHGDAPDELDPEGDLPAYEDIKDHTFVGYDSDTATDSDVGHFEVGTVADVLDEGIHTAYNRALADHRAAINGTDTNDDDEDNGVPAPERVAGTPDGYSHSTVRVTEVYQSEYGLKAVIETPAPWETPDDERPANEVIKSTPWEENHRQFDPEREAWTVDADELVAVASTFRDFGYSVVDERAEGDDSDDSDDSDDEGEDTTGDEETDTDAESDETDSIEETGRRMCDGGTVEDTMANEREDLDMLTDDGGVAFTDVLRMAADADCSPVKAAENLQGYGLYVCDARGEELSVADIERLLN